MRRCRSSQWRLYRGRPDILVSGRYYRVPDTTPVYPGLTHLGSAIWDAGERQVDGPLGEWVEADWQYDTGQLPVPTPLPILVGSPDCLQRADYQLPLPILYLISADAEGPVIVTGDMPDVRVDFGPTLDPNICIAVEAFPDVGVEAFPDIGILVECECNAVEAFPDVAVEAFPDVAVEAICTEPVADCNAVEAMPDVAVEALPDVAIEAICDFI